MTDPSPLFSQSAPSRQALPLASEVLIGLLAPAVLFGILGGRSLSELMLQLGWLSEQLYRGERLPTLNIPYPDAGDEG